MSGSTGSAFDGLGLNGDGSDMGLLGLMQGLGAAATASRLPVSNGSALGMAAAGLMQGQQGAAMNDMRVAAENPPAAPAGWRGRMRRLEEHEASNHETSNDGAYDS